MSKEGYELMGQNLQGYTIIKPIGQGKFSIVYRAEKQGQIYAVKKIKIFDMGDQKQREKCLKEVELMKPLNHPNIIKYVDSFIHNNELIIVTEWAEKGDLKKLIKQHEGDELPFEESVIWQYMRQLSSALKHMHDKRIMHRDLKPANIFISHDSTLKIGDLGLGRMFGSQTLEAYSKVGTPLYMSPELIKDTGYNMNADIWSVGCICYELAELNSPFRNKQEKMSLMDLFDNITRCNYKPISSRFSPELSRAIREMIVVDPNRRMSSQQVEIIAVKNIQNIKKPRLDPYIAMEDIHIKLNLLDYSNMFCKATERNPIHKFYFAEEDKKCPEYDQLFYFMELVYWVMGLAKPDKRKEKLALYTKTQIDWKSPDNACRKLFVDLSGASIKFDDVDVEGVRDGFGESVCLLLNQVLNRELIRSNFQFGQPKQTLVNQNETDSYLSLEGEPSEELEERKDNISEESLEEQSQFEQSIFFNKNKKDNKIGAEDMKLLEKINQFDDDQGRMMIVGKADEKQWKAEYIRVEKQLNDITQSAKDERRKHGYQNFQTSKICSAKLTDLVRFVKPAASVMFRKIDDDLQRIQRGQRRINELFKDQGAQYREKNESFQELGRRSTILTSLLREKMMEVEKIQEKLDDVSERTRNATSESDSNKGSDLRSAIVRLSMEVKLMDQKRGILMMELQKMKMLSRKGDFLEGNFLDD